MCLCLPEMYHTQQWICALVLLISAPWSQMSQSESVPKHPLKAAQTATVTGYFSSSDLYSQLKDKKNIFWTVLQPPQRGDKAYVCSTYGRALLAGDAFSDHTFPSQGKAFQKPSIIPCFLPSPLPAPSPREEAGGM